MVCVRACGFGQMSDNTSVWVLLIMALIVSSLTW